MKSFIDSNVLIYWTDDSSRADVVEQLLADDASISIQVLNEFTNVLFKKRALPLKQIQKSVSYTHLTLPTILLV